MICSRLAVPREHLVRVPHARTTIATALLLLAHFTFPILRAPLEAQTFRSRAAWTSQVETTQGLLDFEGLTPPNGATWGPFLLSGVTVTADYPNSLSILRPTWYPVYTDWGSGDVLHWEWHGYSAAPTTARFFLPSAATALGFDFADATPSAFHVELSTGAFFDFLGTPQPQPPRAMEFWGVVSETPFDWFTVTYDDADPSGLAMLDNLTWGEGRFATVPEPTSFSLTACSLVAFALIRRRITRTRRRR
jgi:hypothetical protein